MGGIWFRGREFITTLSETVGYKTGLALDKQRLRTMVDEVGYGEYWPEDDEALLRIRSEEFKELFDRLLHQLGASARGRVISPLTEVRHRNNDDPDRSAIFDAVASRFVTFLNDAVAAAEPGTKIDPSPFMEAAVEDHGRVGGEVALPVAHHRQRVLVPESVQFDPPRGVGGRPRTR